MGVKKSMQTFFEAMEGNQLPKSGGRIIQTPMGPFTWDNLQESWVNINNGFKLPNMSLQELMMFGYDPSVDGGRDTRVAEFVCTEQFISVFGTVLRDVDISVAGTIQIISTNTTIQTASCAPIITVKLEDTGGTPILFNSFTNATFEYSLNSGSSFTSIDDNTTIQLLSNVLEAGASNAFRLRLIIGSGGSPELSPEFNVILTNISSAPNQVIGTYQVR
jgi:hypothetical protein